MVKGVNKSIIEVKDTHSDYFEKAVFYLRPGVSYLPEKSADREMRYFLERAGLSPQKRRRSLKIGTLFIYAAIAFCIVGIILLK